MDKRTVTFNLPTGDRTIKLFTLHPKKPWVALVTTYNTFSLWNYEQKILIKSFNCNSLEQSGNVDIKELVFYDKHCLSYQNESLAQMKNNIIFATMFKIFFYDYVTDGIKQVNENEMEKKNIKKVCPYSQSKICIGLSDGSLKLYDNKDTIKNSMTTKTIRGYHTKPITHLFTYCQNANQSPCVISVSGADGLMAGWNLETLMPVLNQSQICSPSFKFKRQQNIRSEEIRCFQYDKETYKILTLTDSWISIWSAMTGMEIKRFKNELRLKEVYFFNHFSYGHGSFIGFKDGCVVNILKANSQSKLIPSDQINLKNLIKQSHMLSIRHIFNWPSNPSELFIQTESGLVLIEINSSYRPNFGFNPNFITRLSTSNSKEFIIKGENRINPDINISQAKNAKFSGQKQFNCFYLSMDEEWVYFNLVETQLQSDVYFTRKFKFFRPDPSSLFTLAEGSQSIIEVSFDGKSLILFNKTIFYYEIYALIESHQSDNLLDIHQGNNSIDFYSKLELITKGACRDIAWHQYKNQFAAICPFDKNGQLVTYQKQKQRKSIFGKKGQKPNDKMTGEIDHWCACIFVFTRKTKRYLMVEKSKPIKSHMYRILNMGNIFCYSSQEKSSMETIECLSQDQSLVKQIQGLGFFPLKIYLSYCETYQVLVYETYFVVFKLQQNGYLSYHQTIHEKVLEGIFWQKFFIFSTKNEIYFLQMASGGKCLIKIAQLSPSFVLQKNKQAFESSLIDDLEQQVQIMPQGQLQFFTIVNFQLLAINPNQNEGIVLISLKANPYIQFCIELVCGASDKIAKIYKRSCSQIQKLMRETLSQYGLTVPNIDINSTELII